MSGKDRRAWSEFWALQKGSAKGGGCLPGGWAGIELAQRAVWKDFAKRIARKGRVLDLATGDGRVAAWLKSSRPDCSIVGVDAASTLPSPPKGVNFKPGVAMESLPFPDASFDAVTSQFGFEYGEVVKVAGEAARVAKPGATVGLLVHRGDGPILRHNATRAEALKWALEEQQVVTKARQAGQLGPALLGGMAKRLEAVAAEGRQQFGANSPAWEIPEAVRRTLAYEAQSGARQLLPTLAAIERQAGNEIGRIESLQRACATADARDNLLAALSEAGLRTIETKDVNETGKEPFADFILLEKTA